MKIKPQFCLNGTYYYCDECIIPITNRAFRYGDAVFESMFVVLKKAPLLDKHYSRLREALDYWEMRLPKLFTKERLEREIERLCNKNRLFQGARARLTVFRDGEGLYTPETNEASYLLEVDYYPVQEFTLNKIGLNLGVFEEDAKYPQYENRFKSSQAFLSIKAGLFKKKKSYDEVIFLSPNGFVVEATAYNIFVLKDDVLYTPPLEFGCVGGVMRSVIMEMAPQMGFGMEEKKISLEFLKDAEEVFLTNAVVGVRWVLAFGNIRYFRRYTEKILSELNKTYL